MGSCCVITQHRETRNKYYGFSNILIEQRFRKLTKKKIKTFGITIEYEKLRNDILFEKLFSDVKAL